MEGSDGSNGNEVEDDGIEIQVDEEDNENIKKTERNTSTFDFTEQSWRTDFVLIVEGTKLYVAKNILSLASPVFDTMFQSDFKESSCDELELPGKKLNDVIEFLRCIYPNMFAQITRDNAATLLPLIEEYQVLQLKPRCEAALLESINEESVVAELFRLLATACMYDLKELRQKCIHLASARPDDILPNRETFPPADALNEVLINVNKAMKARLVELEDITEENELLKQHMSAGTRRNKDMKLDSGWNWKERIVALAVAVNEQRVDKEKEVIIWGVPIKICGNIVGNIVGDKLNIEIKNAGKTIVCDIKVRCVLVNRQPNGRNHVVYAEGRFSSLRQTKEIKIEDMNYIEDVNNGFMQNRKVGVIVQLYMSEPNKM